MKERISLSIDKQLLLRLDKEVVTSRSELVEKIIGSHVAGRKSAVVLAGGAHRSLTAEDKTFKPLLRIKGATLIEDITAKLSDAGFQRIFIVGSKEVLSAIYKVIGERGITYVEETRHLGTAKTLALLRDELRSTFLFLPCDHYFELDLAAIERYHKDAKATATLAVYSGVEHEWKKSSIVTLEGNRITEYVEAPKYVQTHLTSILTGFAEPEIFDYIPKSEVSYSLQKDVFPHLAKEGKLVAYVFSSKWKNVHSASDAKEI